MVQVPVFKPGELHREGKRWWHAELRQSVDMPPAEPRGPITGPSWFLGIVVGDAIFCVSYELFAEAISRPSTRAPIVPMSKTPPEMHTNAMHDNAIALMVHLCCEAAKNIYAVYWLEAFDPVRPKW